MTEIVNVLTKDDTKKVWQELLLNVKGVGTQGRRALAPQFIAKAR